MRFESITCPHCGLLCDDLSVEVNELSIRLAGNNHPSCARAFKDASFENAELPSANINGTKASLKSALEAAKKLLLESKQPLISGLIGDVQACRESIALAEKLGGVVDHANGTRMRANSAIMQRFGEVKTTLAEVRNRADCVVILGSNILDNFPRLYERILSPPQSLSGEIAQNKNIFVLDTEEHSNKSNHKNITYLNLEASSLEAIVQRLHGIVCQPQKTTRDNSYMTQALSQLLEVISNSQYTTFIWNNSKFEIKTVEQTLQIITQLIKKLMINNRVVGLSLGGSNAEMTANQVATWQTGVPLPVAFMSGKPVHDPVLYDGMKMLTNNEADTLIWVTTYRSTDIPPDTKIPTIVIGHPKMQCTPKTNVFIPTGIPGIDHRGLAFRTDKVAALPLKAIRKSNLPSASETIRQLTQLI